jgi:Ca2+/Na+ antiporter
MKKKITYILLGIIILLPYAIFLFFILDYFDKIISTSVSDSIPSEGVSSGESKESNELNYKEGGQQKDPEINSNNNNYFLYIIIGISLVVISAMFTHQYYMIEKLQESQEKLEIVTKELVRVNKALIEISNNHDIIIDDINLMLDKAMDSIECEAVYSSLSR